MRSAGSTLPAVRTPWSRKVRALTPHVGAYVQTAEDERLGVRRASAVSGPVSLAPGELSPMDGRLLFGCAAGAVELLEVQPPGGKPMAAADYLRRGGHRRWLRSQEEAGRG